ncbi:hypothetical protein ACQP1G_38950 [Nocardia sp. CA-107356]|uniref:hypothetical protein n=1 Tax=Nocardia sp. CA-107356 TaxID=3239972 RepID=UPI003D8DD4BF
MGQDSSSKGDAARSKLLRLAVIGGVAVVAVLVVIVAFVVASDDGGSTGSVAAPVDRPDDTTPVAAVWGVPKVFLGEWKGVVTDGRAAHDIVLTIKSGKNAEEVATSSDIDQNSGSRCDRIGRMISGTETELVFAARLTGGIGCEAGLSTVELRPDGTVTYHAGQGGAITGTLRKS